MTAGNTDTPVRGPETYDERWLLMAYRRLPPDRRAALLDALRAAVTLPADDDGSGLAVAYLAAVADREGGDT